MRFEELDTKLRQYETHDDYCVMAEMYIELTHYLNSTKHDSPS